MAAMPQLAMSGGFRPVIGMTRPKRPSLTLRRAQAGVERLALEMVSIDNFHA